MAPMIVTQSGQLQSRPANETSQHVRKFSRQSVCSFCITNKRCVVSLSTTDTETISQSWTPKKWITRHLTQSEALSEITSPVFNLHVEHRRLFSRLCNKQIINKNPSSRNTQTKTNISVFAGGINGGEEVGVMEANGSGFRRILLLALCISGIWSAYIYQGVLQETL